MYNTLWYPRHLLTRLPVGFLEYALTPYHSRYFLFGSQLIKASDIRELLLDVAEHLPGPLTFDTFGIDPSKSLLYHLHQFEGSICSKPHDIIYSLLSLSQAATETDLIKVDYDSNFESCLSLTAESILQAKNVKVDRLSVLLAIASTRRASHDLLQRVASWVPDWRIAPSYRFKEHRNAIKFLCEALKTEDYLEGSFGGSTHATAQNIMEFEYKHRGAARVARSLSSMNRPGLKTLGQVFQSGLAPRMGGLTAVGRILKPCFPPVHEPANVFPSRGDVQLNVNTSNRQPNCYTCEIFSKVWEKLSFELREALEELEEQKQVLAVFQYSTVAFAFNQHETMHKRSGVSTKAYEVAYCLDPEIVKGQEECIDLRKWDEFFEQPDVITLQ